MKVYLSRYLYRYLFLFCDSHNNTTRQLFRYQSTSECSFLQCAPKNTRPNRTNRKNANDGSTTRGRLNDGRGPPQAPHGPDHAMHPRAPHTTPGNAGDRTNRTAALGARRPVRAPADYHHPRRRRRSRSLRSRKNSPRAHAAPDRQRNEPELLYKKVSSAVLRLVHSLGYFGAIPLLHHVAIYHRNNYLYLILNNHTYRV